MSTKARSLALSGRTGRARLRLSKSLLASWKQPQAPLMFWAGPLVRCGRRAAILHRDLRSTPTSASLRTFVTSECCGELTHAKLSEEATPILKDLTCCVSGAGWLAV